MVRAFQSIPSTKLTYEKWLVPKKEVKVVSFNIFSDATLHWFGDEVEKGLDDFTWDQRMERISQTLRNINSDVICLQEVKPKSYEFLSKALADYIDRISTEDVLKDAKESGLLGPLSTFTNQR